jgi:DNA-binding Xre family transcriptional regulator
VPKVSIRLNLEKLMEQKGQSIQGRPLTQQDLAEMTGIPQGTISRWVNNKVDSYKREILESLVQALDCELTDLLLIEYSE